MGYLIALNCGSSSIKGKLFELSDEKGGPMEEAGALSVSNIGAKGEQIKVKVKWFGGRGDDVEVEKGDGADVQHKDLFPVLLDHMVGSSGLKKEDIKYITHRIVHGGMNKKGLIVTKGHLEALKETQALSDFAPLHNHHAVLGVEACLNDLPDHTSILLFDTLFHQTIPEEVYTYAFPPPKVKQIIPLRKYGFHGLSYASIVNTLSKYLKKPEDKINIVVAHLGSGASACCIKGGKSIDTTMGLTPLEGLIGGTRTGSIDPTAIFHHSPDYAEDAGVPGMHVTKAELIMNKESGLLALAGTVNFGAITQRKADKSHPEHERCVKAYNVYIDRLMAYLSQYLCKLLAQMPLEDIDGIVFAGGIGENAVELRADVLERFKWLGAAIDEKRNAKLTGEGTVHEISKADAKLKAYVVETNEEGWCAHLAREAVGI